MIKYMHRNKPPPFPAAFLLSACAPDKLDQKFRGSFIAADIVKAYSSDPDGDENSNLAKLLNWCRQVCGLLLQSSGMGNRACSQRYARAQYSSAALDKNILTF